MKCKYIIIGLCVFILMNMSIIEGGPTAINSKTARVSKNASSTNEKHGSVNSRLITAKNTASRNTSMQSTKFTPKR